MAREFDAGMTGPYQSVIGVDKVSGGGLSVYDLRTGRTELVASGVANVQGYGGMLWWSSGSGDELFWHALDLRTAS